MFVGPFELPSLSHLLKRIQTIRPFVFCDSGVFSNETLAFSSALLRLARCHIIPEVRHELEAYLQQPARTAEDQEMTSVLRRHMSPKGNLREVQWIGPPTIGRALMFYANLIGIRKQFGSIARSNPALKDTLTQVGTNALALGKKARAGVVTDEALVTTAYSMAMKSARDVLILTRDTDILLHAYKLQSLIYEDYAAHLLAVDLRKNGFLYGDRIPLADRGDALPFEPRGSFAVSRRLGQPFAMLPEPRSGIGVVYLSERPEVTLFPVPGDLPSFMSIKGRAGNRNTTAFGDLNCYVHLPWLTRMLDLDSSAAPYLYLLADRPASLQGASEVGLSFSTIDVFRSTTDFERPTTTTVFAVHPDLRP